MPGHRHHPQPAIRPLRRPLERSVYTMRSLYGALIISQCVFQDVGALFVIRKVFIRFLTLLVAVLFVTLPGLGLFYLTFSGVVKCIEVGLPALVLIALFVEYAAHFFVKGSGFLFSRRYMSVFLQGQVSLSVYLSGGTQSSASKIALPGSLLHLRHSSRYGMA